MASFYLNRPGDRVRLCQGSPSSAADVAVRGRSLQEVAKPRGIPPETPRQTVESFNACASGEAADPFGRTIKTPPLAGEQWVILGPVKAYFTTTEGSPAISERMEVLDGDGRPIPGLYAVGQNGLGGQVLWGHGLHIAWAITSGRLLGRVLASRASAGVAVTVRS